MKMKRYFCLALVIVFTLSIALTGCGNGSAETSAAEKASTDEAVTASQAEKSSDVPKETVDITWYLAGPQQDPDVDLICQKANEYLKDKLNINLKLSVFSFHRWN